MTPQERRVHDGNPNVAPSQCHGGTSWFDEGEAVPTATSRCGSMFQKWILVVAMCAVAALAHGVDWNSIDYVTLNTSDADSSESSLILGAHWSDTSLPHGDAHYMVANGKTIIGVGNALKPAWTSEPTNNTFQGASLSIAGTIALNICNVRLNNLRIMEGFIYQNNSYGGMYGTATVCTVSSPADFRLVRSATSDVRFPVMSMSFVGDSSAQIRFRRYSGQISSGFKLEESDFSRYFGTIINGTGNDGKGGGTNYYGNAVMPGTCVVANNSCIMLDNAAYAAMVGTLRLESGALIRLKASSSGCSCLTVTNRLEISGNAGIFLHTPVDAVLGVKTRIALLKLVGAAAAAGNLPDIGNLSVEYDMSGVLPNGGVLSLEDDATTGGKTVYCTFSPINKLLKKDSAVSALFVDSETAPTYWSKGHVPQQGDDVYVGTTLYTLAEDGDVDCEADSVTIASGGTLYIQSSEFYAEKIYALAGSTIEVVSGTISTKTIEGFSNAEGLVADELWIGSGSKVCTFAVAQGRSYIITAPLRGTGTVRANTRSSTSYPRGIIAFLADNSGFAGKFIAASLNGQGKFDPSIGHVLKFYMDNANNVGGAMESFTYDGFTVAEDTIVVGRHALTFNVPTRGMFIQNRARFVMQGGERLTLNVPVTYRGEMLFGNDYPTAKYANTGAGTGDLVLGGRALFLNDGGGVSDVPDAGSASNRLLMVVGRVKPTVTNALDGVAVTFGADSGGILLDIDPAGDGMAGYGLVDVKWDVPFTNNRADGKIPVTFEGMAGDSYSGPMFTRAICTVNAIAAQNLSDDDFMVAKPYSNVSVKVGHASNADGSVTYRATFRVEGMTVLVR